MKHLASATVSELFNDIFKATMQAGRRLAHAIGAMAWPQLLATCVLLAILITIVPLALTLFIAFMLVKLVVAALVLQTRRARGQARPG
ncbi:hypothetical protein [Massilia sp. PWRC2]|uniref:hypothetical protein n=1 Tax=Massilia sp. PWRC2 TaxID=2804626 RepID=UPI003CEDDEC3